MCVKDVKRWWAKISQPGTGGLIQPGDWRVRYTVDGQKTHWMSYGDAENYKNVFGGVVEWRGDHEENKS